MVQICPILLWGSRHMTIQVPEVGLPGLLVTKGAFHAQGLAVVARTLQTAISFAAIAVMGGCAYDGPVVQHDADTYSAQYTTDHRMGCVPALAGAQLKAERFCYARQLTSQDTDKQCTETSIGFWRARVQFHCIQSASLSQPKQ